MVDGNPTHRVGAAAVGPDQGSGGSGVGQRLIPEEPMSIAFNLAISREHFIFRKRVVNPFLFSELAADGCFNIDISGRV